MVGGQENRRADPGRMLLSSRSTEPTSTLSFPSPQGITVNVPPNTVYSLLHQSLSFLRTIKNENQCERPLQRVLSKIKLESKLLVMLI